MPCVLLTSARGPPNADVIMAFDDASIDSVNIDQVNGQRVHVQSAGSAVSGVHQSVSQERLPCGSRVSAGFKTKLKERVACVRGLKAVRAGSTAQQARLGSAQA